MSPRIVNKEEKKRHIVAAAMQVFAKKGLYNTKMTDIALAADIGKGTIYEYFKSKDEIFWAAFNIMMEDMETEMARKLFKVNDPAEKLAAIIEAFFGSLETFHDSAYIMFDFWAEGIRKRDDQTDNFLRKFYTEYRKLIASIIEEGKEKGSFCDVDSNIIASTILGALDGLILQWIIFGHDYNVEKAIEEFKSMVLSGIKK